MLWDLSNQKSYYPLFQNFNFLDKMKKIFILLISLLIRGCAKSFARSYPVKQVEGNFCGQTGWLCKIDLPRIEKADYLKYQNFPRYRQIYTVMWWGTYFGGWDFWFWSHQGVDIASIKGTPIYSAGDGEVVLAESRGERGNTVVTRHNWKNLVLHTVYAHLETIEVKVWDQVKEGQLIAKMGATGNATGPHVHFQIDTNEGKHPYFPKGCGGTIAEVVNQAKCWNQIKQNTLDPILFLETQGTVFLAEKRALSDQKDSSFGFLEARDLEIKMENPILMQGSLAKISLQTKNDRDGFLADELTFSSTSDFEFFPSKVSYIGSWRSVSFVPKQAGLYPIYLKSKDKTVKTLRIFVLDEATRKILEQKAESNPTLQEVLNNIK